MATTKTRSTRNAAGSSATAVKTNDAGGTVAAVARRASTPALAAAAGLAGGVLIGSRAVSRRKHRVAAMTALAAGLKQAATAARKASSTADDIHALREHLDKVNRRSPIEVVLEGLTHRRGAPRGREH